MSVSRIAILKFGGTSVASPDTVRRMVEIVLERRKQGYAPVVVVSALTKVTDRLVRISKRESIEQLLAETDAQHAALASALGLDVASVAPLWQSELQAIRDLFVRVGERRLTPVDQARVQAAGERMSSRLLAAFFNQALAAHDLQCHWQDVTEWLTSTPLPHRPATSHYLNAHCEPQRNESLHDFAVAFPGMLITQGFMARNAAGETVILGRGGSDTSAAYLSVLLGADVLEIWTDVPGMFTGNPRQFPDARLLRTLDYDEAQEMATTGAKVLHPRCVRPARLAKIPIRVAWTAHPEIDGTWVREQEREVAGLKSVSVNGPITLISLETEGMWQQVGFMADAFAVFKLHGLSIDLVSTSETCISVTLDNKANDVGPEVLEALRADLSELCTVSINPDCASVTLVGRRVRTVLHALGSALQVFTDYPVHLMSQAASDLNVSFVIDAKHADDVCAQLHAYLLEHTRDDDVFGPDWQSLRGDPQAPQNPAWWQARREQLLTIASEGPRYVYSRQAVREAAAKVKSLAGVSRRFYAVKANDHAEILQVLAEEGFGFECVSPGELAQVRSALPDLPAERILFTPNFAPREDYELVAKEKIWLTLDNLYPLQQWPKLFAGREILLRLDPGTGHGHHAHVRTGGLGSKFGIPLSDVDEALRLAHQCGARIIGLHAHVGSGILTPDTWVKTAQSLAAVAQRIPSVRILNLGGGLGVPYQPQHRPLDLAALSAALAGVKAKVPALELWLEPGRFLVAEAGVLLARVTQTKGKGDYVYVGVETGMNSLIRPALYEAYHPIFNLSRLHEPATQNCQIVGPICETGDQLGEEVLPPSTAGDVLLIAFAGAYGHAMSSHYNRREPAQEVVID